MMSTLRILPPSVLCLALLPGALAGPSCREHAPTTCQDSGVGCDTWNNGCDAGEYCVSVQFALNGEDTKVESWCVSPSQAPGNTYDTGVFDEAFEDYGTFDSFSVDVVPYEARAYDASKDDNVFVSFFDGHYCTGKPMIIQDGGCNPPWGTCRYGGPYYFDQPTSINCAHPYFWPDLPDAADNTVGIKVSVFPQPSMVPYNQIQCWCGSVDDTSCDDYREVLDGQLVGASPLWPDACVSGSDGIHCTDIGDNGFPYTFVQPLKGNLDFAGLTCAASGDANSPVCKYEAQRQEYPMGSIFVAAFWTTHGGGEEGYCSRSKPGGENNFCDEDLSNWVVLIRVYGADKMTCCDDDGFNKIADVCDYTAWQVGTAEALCSSGSQNGIFYDAEDFKDKDGSSALIPGTNTIGITTYYVWILPADQEKDGWQNWCPSWASTSATAYASRSNVSTKGFLGVYR